MAAVSLAALWSPEGTSSGGKIDLLGGSEAGASEKGREGDAEDGRGRRSSIQRNLRQEFLGRFSMKQRKVPR